MVCTAAVSVNVSPTIAERVGGVIVIGGTTRAGLTVTVVDAVFDGSNEEVAVIVACRTDGYDTGQVAIPLPGSTATFWHSGPEPSAKVTVPSFGIGSTMALSVAVSFG